MSWPFSSINTDTLFLRFFLFRQEKHVSLSKSWSLEIVRMNVMSLRRRVCQAGSDCHSHSDATCACPRINSKFRESTLRRDTRRWSRSVLFFFLPTQHQKHPNVHLWLVTASSFCEWTMWNTTRTKHHTRHAAHKHTEFALRIKVLFLLAGSSACARRAIDTSKNGIMECM